MKGWLKKQFPTAWKNAAERSYRWRFSARQLGRKLRRNRFGFENARNLILDLRYGGYCGGRVPSRFEELGAHATTSTFYSELAELFDPDNGIRVSPSDVLVDIGCGKGRVVNFWLKQGLLSNRLIGLELDPDFAAETQRRLAPYHNVHIIVGDAIENLPIDGTLFYLYNPFGPVVVHSLADRLFAIAKTRDIRIVYFSCFFLDAFSRDQWDIRHLPLNTLMPAVLITPKKAAIEA